MFQMPSWEVRKLRQPICHGPSWAQLGLFPDSGSSPINVTIYIVYHLAVSHLWPRQGLPVNLHLSATIHYPAIILYLLGQSPPHTGLHTQGEIFYTLQHVPKGARDAWAGLIADQCSSIGQDPSNSHAWRKFFMLPRCILANPTSDGRTQWRITQ